ncbi:hypothetical protein F5J12DRAFT_718758 [Pisolithus orientalis]|uniref:uncharacterized protein n=1 Tax=Pisolithus orientalis TaxID=936130 RepID=UPI002224D46D|nr:uncharacterized protein F5J12DRAFT_718758 [Pisolithus orientalis]KAI6010867.1 hypothetical protein F5J12DRAFT_718758 [Pisolithus orientalis]
MRGGRSQLDSRCTRATASLSGLLDAFQYGIQLGSTSGEETRDDGCFDTVVEGLLPEYLQTRHDVWAQRCDVNESGEVVRPLSRYETTAILGYVNKTNKGTRTPSVTESIILRKLELQRQRGRSDVQIPLRASKPSSLTSLQILQLSSAPPAVIDHLRTIQSTRYENSFASRLYGSRPRKVPGLIAVDWETHTPWMNLLEDIHEHYSLVHAERDQPGRMRIPITYTSLQPHHLSQVHDLLTRVFWDGINISDSLKYSPERCTVIATYGHLVVGVALLSSPQETYITYLAVRVGWDNSQIAAYASPESLTDWVDTTMLYHLISLNPHRDITLHVSANNPAMLLYNRFGFKAEEFIVGFYEDYLSSQSRASMNAFRLRLRR